MPVPAVDGGCGACSIVTVRPAIVTVPVRAWSVGLLVTLYCTIPLDWLDARGAVIRESLLAAVHAPAPVVVTVISPERLPDAADTTEGVAWNEPPADSSRLPTSVRSSLICAARTNAPTAMASPKAGAGCPRAPYAASSAD